MEQTNADWDFYFCRVENKPASISVDLGLKKTAPIPEYDKRYNISVKFKRPDENGFSTREEFQILCDIEDALTEAMVSLDAIQVGRLKSDGQQELFFYGPSNEDFEYTIDEVMSGFPDYLYAADCTDDPEWTDYFDFLYPEPYYFQSIQNRRVIQQLEAQGNDHDKKREVDHWIYFSTETGRDRFAVEVEKNGFTVISKQQNEDREHPFTINISRGDTTNWDDVNEYVWFLCDTAEANEGVYDGWGCTVEK